MKRVGKKTREWERIRRELKKRFLAAGITTCELKFPQCWHNNGLSFAHAKKRRFLTTEGLRKLVVLACAPCHTAIEGMPHDAMFVWVMDAIKRRPVPVDYNDSTDATLAEVK